MLSGKTFLETRIQSLQEGLSIVEKSPGVHVQRMLKMNLCLYTDEMFKQIISGDFCDNKLTNKTSAANFSFCKYLQQSLFARLTSLHTRTFD